MAEQKKARARRMARPASQPAAPVNEDQQQGPGAKATKTSKPLREKKPSKAVIVLSLLQRPEGASLDELVTATSWLPHTTRAALTGLRQKGHVIAKSKVDGVTRYSIATAVQS